MKPAEFSQNRTQKDTSYPSPVSPRSNSSPEVNSNCCHRSDAWSHLE